jgi:transcription termination factor Rho
MELHLDRRLADKRIYPSIDIEASGTRQEELILDPELLQKLTVMRRMLYMLGEEERTQLLIEKLEKTETNEEFLNSLKPS